MGLQGIGIRLMFNVIAALLMMGIVAQGAHEFTSMTPGPVIHTVVSIVTKGDPVAANQIYEGMAQARILMESPQSPW
mgnify:CR=1 FL=1|jgi:hypothetical protein